MIPRKLETLNPETSKYCNLDFYKSQNPGSQKFLNL
jgi:hypothetical protein